MVVTTGSTIRLRMRSQVCHGVDHVIRRANHGVTMGSTMSFAMEFIYHAVQYHVAHGVDHGGSPGTNHGVGHAIAPPDAIVVLHLVAAIVVMPFG